MIANDDLTRELIAELHNAIKAASREYFIWTKGRLEPAPEI